MVRSPEPKITTPAHKHKNPFGDIENLTKLTHDPIPPCACTFGFIDSVSVVSCPENKYQMIKPAHHNTMSLLEAGKKN